MANGVNEKIGSFRERVLFQYEFQQRLVRFKETLLLLSGLVQPGKIGVILEDYTESLFPELKKSKAQDAEEAKELLKELEGLDFSLAKAEGGSLDLKIRKKSGRQDPFQAFIEDRPSG